MPIQNVIKRDGSIRPYRRDKITEAIYQAFEETDEGGREAAEAVAKRVEQALEEEFSGVSSQNLDEISNPKSQLPEVETIQDIVEEKLMDSDFHTTAKAYIVYRQKRAESRQPDLFQKRTRLKPYEYPELADYVDAIRHSYWIHTEFNYTSDEDDIKTNVTQAERTAIERAMLAISQVEVAVKTFWGDIYKTMPKPEIGAVGATFAESEVRHMDAYSHLLDILSLNEKFKGLERVPVIQERMRYLDAVSAPTPTADNKDFTRSVLLFSLFIEHVSLFSQFLIIMSFNKHKNLFSGISNVVEATSKEEKIHGQFGIDLVNRIRKENPEWFDEDFEESVRKLCRESLETEKRLIEWIFADGELEFLPKDVVVEFVKNRMNNSLESAGFDVVFDTDETLVEQTRWFEEEVIATKHVDFFEKRSINYSKRTQSVTSDDLF